MGNITKLALRNAMVRAARLVKESSGARTAREWRSGKGAQMLRLRFCVPQCCGKRDFGRRANDPGESELWRTSFSRAQSQLLAKASAADAFVDSHAYP